MVKIRLEEYEDIDAVNSVLVKAFRDTAEAELVKRMREEEEFALSLVAEEAGRIIGYAAYSPVTVEFDLGGHSFLGLAPLAVLPASQRQGVGTRLVRKGSEACLAMGYRAIFAVGPQEFFNRSGFRRADRFGLYSELDETGDQFQVLPLHVVGMDGMGGLVSYHTYFNELKK